MPEAPEPDFPFDAVLFDLDGTLVATDRIWVEAADRGCRRAFRELGLERDPPDGAGWMSLVGLPLDQGFRALFPDLEPEALAVVVERCLEAEREALAAGVAELLPGAREALEDLRRRGVKTAIASNCGGEYLAAMCDGLGLGALVDEAWCLDSPGVETKADMLRLALERFETRSAVMVGDRWTDLEAARANALPHVHLAHGFAPAGERIEADAVIGGLDELVPCLLGRERWIEAALRELGLLDAEGVPCGFDVTRVAVTGCGLAGKTLFARDAARLMRRRGRPAWVSPGSDVTRAAAEGLTFVEAGPRADLAECQREVSLTVSEATRAVRRSALGGPETGTGREAAARPPAGLVLSADNPLG